MNSNNTKPRLDKKIKEQILDILNKNINVEVIEYGEDSWRGHTKIYKKSINFDVIKQIENL